MTYLLKYYVSAFTNTKSDHTLPIRYNNFTRRDTVLRHAQDIVWQFTLLYIAQCHDKKSEYCQFFPVYWFWATVCASTRDNRYNCALGDEYSTLQPFDDSTIPWLDDSTDQPFTQSTSPKLNDSRGPIISPTINLYDYIKLYNGV